MNRFEPDGKEARKHAAPPAAGSVAHGLPLLAEVLAVGAMTTLAALGVVTAFGAIAAGCASLREYLEHDEPPGPRRYLVLLRAASHGAIPLLAPPALGIAVAADLLAWHAGMPGGSVLCPAALTVGSAATVAGLRGAASWEPERGCALRPAQWKALLPNAARETASDWRGSLLIAGALAACVALAFEIPALTLTLPGLLTFGTVAVRLRAH